MEDVFSRARAVKLAVFDVDGVLTDARLYYSDSGEELKAFHTRDGHGMKMLKAAGIEIALLSGRASRSLEARARNLGVTLLYQGIQDKLAAFRELLAQLSLAAAAAAYMGDDVVDLPVMRHCGLALAVPDAPPLVRQHAHYVTQACGGQGAVREACELVLLAQGMLEAQLAPYLE